MSNDLVIQAGGKSAELLKLASLERRHIQPGPVFADYFRAAVVEPQKSPPAFESVMAPILKAGGAIKQGPNPMKFGIMQSTLRDYDPRGAIARNVSELTEDKARRIYMKIWERSGSSRLPDDLAAAHFKAYIRRPKTALAALKQAGGDAAIYQQIVSVGKPNTPATAAKPTYFPLQISAMPATPPPQTASMQSSPVVVASDERLVQTIASTEKKAEQKIDIMASSSSVPSAPARPAPSTLWMKLTSPQSPQAVIARMGENNVDLTVGGRSEYRKMAEQLGREESARSGSRPGSPLATAVIVSLRIPL